MSKEYEKLTEEQKAIEYVDKLWKQQPNEFGIMPDLGNEFMWVVDFMKEQEVELKALKNDVARFLEVTAKPMYRPLHGEAYDLYEKLMKECETNE